MRPDTTAMLIAGSERGGRAYGYRSALDTIGTVHWIDSSPERSDAEYETAFDRLLPEIDLLVVSAWNNRVPQFTPERFSRASRLKVIAGTFDNRFGNWIDVQEAASHGIVLIDTSRTMTPTVAEFALAMTLTIMRDIPAAVQMVRDGGWQTAHWDQPGFVYGDLTGRRIGLAGFGVINRRYAELIAPFHCDVRTCDPYVDDQVLHDAGVGRAESLAALASSSDIFVIGIPPTPATLQIIDREVIDALPRGSTLILVTRMAVMEQEPLWRRLRAGEIRAAIDVFDPEPPPADAWFRQSPYVYPTPHIAGNTSDCHRRCFTIACDEALNVLDGLPVRYAATVRDDRIYRGANGGTLRA
jgi:phosphoglycerate dehydrogenase-like enzyme